MTSAEIDALLTEQEKGLRERLSTEDWFIVKAGFRRSYEQGRADAPRATRKIEWGSRDMFERVHDLHGQGSEFWAVSMLEVNGKPVYRIRTVYEDHVGEWQDFTAADDPDTFRNCVIGPGSSEGQSDA